MAKKSRVGVLVKTEWISNNGFETLFKGAWATRGGDAVVEAKDYSLADYSFVEVEFNPASVNGSVRLFIPREAVTTIVELPKSGTVSQLGFKPAK